MRREGAVLGRRRFDAVIEAVDRLHDMAHARWLTIKRIAISTGGGDAPGLNAVIRAATLAARNRGWDVVGIRDGFNGLINPELYPNGGLVTLTRESVRGIVHQGGTIIGTTNRGNPTAYPVQQPDGTWIEVDRTRSSSACSPRTASTPSSPSAATAR